MRNYENFTLTLQNMSRNAREIVPTAVLLDVTSPCFIRSAQGFSTEESFPPLGEAHPQYTQAPKRAVASSDDGISSRRGKDKVAGIAARKLEENDNDDHHDENRADRH